MDPLNMNLFIFGSSGMVGQAALRAATLDPGVKSITTIVRRSQSPKNSKVKELLLGNLRDISKLSSQVAGCDLAIFAVGVTSAGMSEQEYTAFTYGLTIEVAEAMLKHNKNMKFIYVSGSGADSSEKGKAMWPRVRGKTENKILSMGFQDAYIVRPAVIIPMDEIYSKTTSYRIMYSILKPVLPVFKLVVSNYVTTTRELGKVFLEVGRKGYSKKILESQDIVALGKTI